MGQGDHRNHREAEVEKRPGIVTDRSTTGGEFHHTSAAPVDDGELVVRGQLLVDRLVLEHVVGELPEGTRSLPASDIGGDRLGQLLQWAAAGGQGDGGGQYGAAGTSGTGGSDAGSYGQAGGGQGGVGGDGGQGGDGGDGGDDEGVPFVRFELPAGEDLLCVVRRLRQRFGSAVGPNHVFFGEQSFAGSPASPPAPAPPGWISRPGRGPSVGRVGIIDTGFADFSATTESDRLDGIDRAPFSVDEPDADPVDGKLDWEAGHGTFIAGQVRHAQPDAEIVVIKGLDGFGTISEADLCHLMLIAARRGIDVLNLSLGGYALDDECPSGLSATLAQLVYRRDLVIVAAAGNKGSDRPFWPAASKHVVAVGALNEARGWPAWFTNFGPWVDACAPGVDRTSWFFDFDGGLDAVPTSGVVEDFEFWATWSGTSFAAPQFCRGCLRPAGQARAGGNAHRLSGRGPATRSPWRSDGLRARNRV